MHISNTEARLGKDPELSFSATALPITKVSVAVNFPRKVNDKWEDNTSWFNITSFGKTAERLQHCQKGDLILITDAVLQNNNYEKNGQPVYSDNIIVNKFHKIEVIKL